jgi:hypothetical protein
MAKMFNRTCAECDVAFQSVKDTAQFCCTEHRKDYHNRAQTVGREMYHLVMSMRYDRKAAAEQGAWTLLCKVAEEAQNHKNKGKRRFDTPNEVLERNPQLRAVVVAKNYRCGR